MTGIAIAAAAEMEKLLKSPEERIIALGTGRALRACVEQLPRMDCPQHRIVSRLGNMMSDGSATPYNAVIRMAERVGAKHYPFPLPVVARDEEELRVMHGQEPVRHTMQLCARADFTLVGVGQIGMNAPLHVDGFMQAHEMNTLVAQGAAGEITSWVYDTEGRVMDCAFNMRVASAPLTVGGDAPVVGLAAGPDKAEAIRAALRSRGVRAVIPQPSDQIAHRKKRGAAGGRPPAFDATAYKGRNVIERSFNDHKQWRGIATRYDKLATVYRGAVVLRAITIWLAT